MARKIILKEDGLTGSGDTPSGYRYFGYNGTTTSEKYGATVSAIGGGSEYTESVFTFTASQIYDNNGLKPALTLLPAQGVNELYDIDYITYYCSAADFSHSSNFWIYIDGKQFTLAADLLNGGGEKRMITGKNPHSQQLVGGVLIHENLLGNTGGFLYSAEAPTQGIGTGTITLKIYHKTITFGS